MADKKNNRKIGNLGETLVCRHLMKKGFEIVERNYWKKYGEIDIIARNRGKIHFIEVKSVSRENLEVVSHETGFRPEENVHPAKLRRLSRVIQVYLLERNVSDETDWQFDVITAYIDIKNLVSKIHIIENVII